MNLLAAAALLLFSSGRWIVPLAAWLSPVFLLRFAGGGRALPRLLISAALLYATACVTWWGMVPVPPPAYFLIMLMIALPTVIPYVLHRALAAREGGLGTTFAFPCAWVATEYAVSLASPYGSWGSTAYTQVDNLPLLQSASVAGLWGIAFLMAWFASIANWAWGRGFEWPTVRAGVLGYPGVLAAVLLLGGARLALDPPSATTIRVASFTVPPPERLSPWVLLTQGRSGASLDSLRADLLAHQDSLFAAVMREAAAGAQVVAWSEVNAFVLKDEEAAFEERAASVARESGVTLVTGQAVFTPGQGYYENELVVLSPEGETIARYHKARPVPGDPERGADKVIPLFPTPLARFAGAVCFDGDFPDLIRKAGRGRADVLVIPSSDWRAIDPIHTRMALVRGVENGCSVVRQTNKGLSAAADYQGRILAAMDFFHSDPRVMVAQVPSRGVWTLYPRCPDLLPLLCIGGLGAMSAGKLKRRRRIRSPAS